MTGGIAEGKSTVLAHVANMGYKTLSADDVARDVFSDPDVNRLLAAEVGAFAPIDAATLRDELIRRPEIRRAVNRIMHPRIVAAISDSDAEFVEIPLLIETCLQGLFDGIWIVTCGRDEQVKRLVARYGPGIDVERVLSTQLRTSSKIPFADEVIRTNCDFETVSRHVSEALKRRLE